MAATLSESGLEEGEYESDSDGTSALALRRREASDDEEDRGGVVMDAADSADDAGSRHQFSDEEGDGEDIPPADEDEEEEEEEEDNAGLLRRRREGSDEEDGNEVDSEGLHPGEGSKSGEKNEDAQGKAGADTGEGKEGGEEEKKEAEPFVVPTAGAFYMHDDRFRAVGGARPRRGVGGRKLWEAKDDKPWVHDLFEELNIREENYSEEGPRMAGRGRSRGRGRVNRDFKRGWVGKLASDAEELNISRARRGRGRGRTSKTEGVDRSRSEEQVPTTNTYGNKGSQDASGNSSLEGQQESKQHGSLAPLRKVAAGSLNSASPPFFPSGALQQKSAEGPESIQGNSSQNSRVKERVPRNPGSLGTPVFVAKPSTGSGRVAQSDGTPQTSTQPQQPAKQSRAQPSAQPGRVSSSQAQSVLPPQPQAQLQAQLTQAPGSTAQASTRVGSANAGQPARLKSNGGRGSRGGNYQVVGGGGPFMYNGGPSVGMNSGVRMGEPGFSPAIPAVGPVAVQYGGQPPAGMAVPTVGMAMPNYSGQPQFGFPNSEVAWVPVLAGGGAIGAGYAAPYMTMEGSPSPMYYTQPATQPASLYPTGREVPNSKPSVLWKPPPNQELGPDEFGQRQSKPRRYSEMSFGQ